MKFKKLFLSLVFTLLFISPSVFAMERYNQEEQTPTKCAKVSVIGNLGSGKTSIYKSVIGEEVILRPRTDADNTRVYRQENICKIVNGTVLLIRFLDTPGLAEYRDEVISKLVNNNIIYFVLDTTHRYNGDMQEYIDTMIRAIEPNNPNCKIVFLFTKYDNISECMSIAIENSNLKLGLQGLHKECYFTSSKADFVNEDNDFINARYLKSHMINYLRQHINELPDHHETTEIRSDWEIRENEERLTRERDERTQERDTLNRELDVQRQVSGELRNENGRLTQELQARTRERDERQETINHRQRVLDWYKERKGWFTGNCPFE